MFCLFFIASSINEAGEVWGICVEVQGHHVFEKPIPNYHKRLLSSGLFVMTCNHRSCSLSLPPLLFSGSATSHCASPRLHASSEAFPALFVFLAADESSWTGLYVGWIAVSRSGWRFTRRAGLSDVQSHWVEACIHFTAGFTHIHTHFFFAAVLGIYLMVWLALVVEVRR